MDNKHALDEVILDTELRHVNFFNGRLLSGEDLSAERDANHAHLRHLGQSVGAGVASGLEVERATDGAANDVRVKKGLAVNRAGHTLHLKCDQLVSIIPPPDPSAPADCVFSDCAPLAVGSTPSEDGGYSLLTIAPASQREGLAPISGLGNNPASCNSRYFTEGVQFRLLPMTVNPGADTNRARNVVAYQCLGLPPLGPSDFARAASAPEAAPLYGLESLVPAGRLTEHDVPLAVIEWKAGGGLGVIDMWPVRRRMTSPAVGKVWGYFTDDRRRVEAEAAWLQFQDHAASILLETGVAPAMEAASRFRYLPPAGFLKVGGTNFAWKKFLGPQAPESATPLDEGLVRSVLRHSLGQEPVPVGGNGPQSSLVPFHVYRVSSQSDYVLFARSSLGEVLAADVLFDNSRCKLPGVETVQGAIEALCEAYRGCCTLVVHPGPNWETVFDRINPGQDAEVCFQAGTFSSPKPVAIIGKGHLRIIGSGRATQIVCTNGESALRFKRCASVSIAHLSAESGVIAPGHPSGQHLSGALDFVECPSVEVEHVSLRCPPGVMRMAACLAVRNAAAGPGRVRVRACQCEVGREQVGILLVNTERALIEDNELRTAGTVTWERLVENKVSRARLRRHLISQFGDRKDHLRNAFVSLSGHTVAFRTPAAIAHGWSAAVAKIQGVNSSYDLVMALKSVAERVLKNQKVLGFGASPLNQVFGSVAERTSPAGSQGIVVAGSTAADVRILHNTLVDFIQGIHVGVSHSDSTRLASDHAGTVLILANTIAVRLTAGSTRGRHGIFVGNCESLVIERNRLTLSRAKAAQHLAVEGLRLFGKFGRRVLIRENHLTPATAGSIAFDVGIRFRPLDIPAKAQLWIIGDNVFESSKALFQIETAVQPFLRHLNTNVA